MKKYITQITSDDLRKMLRMGNLKVGDGLEIVEDESGPTIQIDKQRLKVMIWSLVNQNAFPPAVTGVTLSELYGMKLDPPS